MNGTGDTFYCKSESIGELLQRKGKISKKDSKNVRISELNAYSLLCRTIQDPRSQRLTWYKPPLSVLVIKKIFDAEVIGPYLELITWLVEVTHSAQLPRITFDA